MKSLPGLVGLSCNLIKPETFNDSDYPSNSLFYENKSKISAGMYLRGYFSQQFLYA
jgi:hypothetical protein